MNRYKAARLLVERFNIYISELPEDANVEHVLSCVLLSTVLFDGVWSEAFLKSFARALCNPPYHWRRRVWYECQIDSVEHGNNRDERGSAVLEWRLEPGPTTAALLIRLYRNWEPLETQQCLATFDVCKRFIALIARLLPSVEMSISIWLKTIAEVQSMNLTVPLEQHQIDALQNKLVTVPINHANWRQIVAPSAPEVSQKYRSAYSFAHTHYNTVDHMKAIRDALKLTIKESRLALLQMINEGGHDGKRIVANYLLHQIAVAGNKLSAVSRDASFLRLFTLPEFENLQGLSSDEFLSALSNLIRKSPTNTDKHRVSRINKAMALAAQEGLLDNDFRSLSSTDNDHGVVTRAGLLAEPAFRCLSERVMDFACFEPSLVERALLHINHVGKFALRPVESREIRSKDLLSSESLYVKESKTINSSRQLPVSRIVTLSDWMQLSPIYNRYTYSHVLNANHRLLSGDASGYVDVHYGKLAKFISNQVRALTGNPHASFYSLRHSAITRLYLLIYASPKLGSRLLCISEDEFIGMQNRLPAELNDEVLSLYQLAAFSGHGSPATTLSNYVHMLHEVARDRLVESNPCLSGKQLAAITTTSPISISKLAPLKRSKELSAVEAQQVTHRLLKRFAQPMLRPDGKPIAKTKQKASTQKPKATLCAIEETLASIGNGLPAKDSMFPAAVANTWVETARLLIEKLGSEVSPTSDCSLKPLRSDQSAAWQFTSTQIHQEMNSVLSSKHIKQLLQQSMSHGLVKNGAMQLPSDSPNLIEHLKTVLKLLGNSDLVIKLPKDLDKQTTQRMNSLAKTRYARLVANAVPANQPIQILIESCKNQSKYDADEAEPHVVVNRRLMAHILFHLCVLHSVC
ncbi:hypothetical protein IC617_07515 [Neiella sp. HB171785]|uniref:Tyr recombinase domain-containing protein n=1 Tax=Neiella litorisoli TaxID=2771431 RepID=A0A8J6UIW1_9GAMM|nr:hypothetical protein [Neiella litorisoli]MBD1389268.1 hypothetical protein [Neiella litorisoli]